MTRAGDSTCRESGRTQCIDKQIVENVYFSEGGEFLKSAFQYSCGDHSPGNVGVSFTAMKEDACLLYCVIIV